MAHTCQEDIANEREMQFPPAARQQ